MFVRLLGGGVYGMVVGDVFVDCLYIGDRSCCEKFVGIGMGWVGEDCFVCVLFYCFVFVYY